jgi:LacI family transcriptional regulator
MSITEIAKIAGVSHMTVARVVNDTGNVSSQTVDKVRKVMEMVGYVPKPPEQRRGPRRSQAAGFKTGNVAFITSAQGLHILGGSPVMMSVVRGIEETLAFHGMSMIQCAVNSTRELPPIITRGEVDGVIIWPSLEGASQETIDILSNYQRVYVMTGREKYLPGDRVLNDNEQVGVLAANFLLSKGHSNLLQLDFKDRERQRTAWIDRWYGFEETAVNAIVKRVVLRIDSNETLLPRVSNEQEICESLSDALLGDNKPTGIFCTSDSMTAIIYPLMRRIGINVGSDVEIVSCNNETSILTGLDPMPASIDICPEKIGAKAVEQLRWRISHPDNEHRVLIEIKPKLVTESERKNLKFS